MTRQTCEDTPAIDIGDWAAEDLLVPGARWVINTFKGDQKSGTVRAAIGDGRVTLNFETRDREGKWRPRSQDFALTYTIMPGPGGRRPWFLCPACERRCAIVYCRRGRFACRVCQDLSYRSQRASYRNHRRQRTEPPAEAPAETASPPA